MQENISLELGAAILTADIFQLIVDTVFVEDADVTAILDEIKSRILDFVKIVGTKN